MPKYEVRFLPVESLLPNPLRPRFSRDHTQLLELADSIRQYGIFHPLLVGDTATGLQIISGERRWRAAKLIGLKEVPSVVVKVTSRELITIFWEENLQRQELHLLEKGHALQKLLQIPGVTKEQVSDVLRLDSEEVDRLLALTTIPDYLREQYLQGEISEEELLSRVKNPVVY